MIAGWWSVEVDGRLENIRVCRKEKTNELSWLWLPDSGNIAGRGRRSQESDIRTGRRHQNSKIADSYQRKLEQKSNSAESAKLSGYSFVCLFKLENFVKILKSTIIDRCHSLMLRASLRQSTPGSGYKSAKLMVAKNISRPQLNFKDKVDNSARPFVPIIKEKPNALRPLSGQFLLSSSSVIELCWTLFEYCKGIETSSLFYF